MEGEGYGGAFPGRPSPDALLNPRLDPIFKAMFTQDSDDSRRALVSFLSAATGRDVESVDVRIVQNEPPVRFADEYQVRYDISCEFSDGTRAQVEMQGFDQAYDYGKRAEQQAARLASAGLRRGGHWADVSQVYQITVLNFPYDGGSRSPVHRYRMIDPADGAALAGVLNVVFLELTKIPQYRADELGRLPPLVKWGLFLRDADRPERRDVVDLLAQEEGIMGARAALVTISRDSELWMRQWLAERTEIDYRSGLAAAKAKGYSQGRDEGYSQGRDEGYSLGVEKTLQALGLLRQGTAPESVAERTGLPLDAVRRLRAQSELKLP